MADLDNCMLIINGQAVNGLGGSSETVILDTYEQWLDIPDRLTDGKIYIIKELNPQPECAEIEYDDWIKLSDEERAVSGFKIVKNCPDGMTIAQVNEKVDTLRNDVNKIQTGTLIDGGYGISASFIKRNGLTTMLINGTVTKELTGGTNLIGTIPEGFRPMQQTTGWTIYGNSSTVCYVNAYPDGRLFLCYRVITVGTVVQILPFSYFSN